MGELKKNKLIDAVLSNFVTDEVFWENEVEANKLVAKVLGLNTVIVLLSWALNEAGVFTISRDIMKMITVQCFFELMIPVVLCWHTKGETRWIKYLMMIMLTITLARMDSVLSYNVILSMAIPVVLSCRYYSKSFTAQIATLTTILFGVSAYCGAYFGMAERNLMYPAGSVEEYTKVYMTQHFFPKWLVFLLISIICAEIAARGKKMVLQQDSISQEHSRVETELDMAKKIQERALPIVHTLEKQEDPLFDLSATMVPAKEVGGDFYDFFYIDPTHLALMIADVSGKGVPAALFMMVSKILLDNSITGGKTPGQVLADVNHQLCEKNLEDMFVTAWLGILDLETGSLITANAGHEYPVICHADGEFELFKDKHGFVLGGMDGMRYKESEIKLEPGDTLYVYTDGVPEANNDAQEQFGIDRMLASLNSHKKDSMDELLKNVKADIDAFADNAPQFDDTTMLALHLIHLAEKEGIRTKADQASIPVVSEYIEETMSNADVPMKIITKVNIAVDEIYSNIVRYSGATWAHAVCKVDNGMIFVTFRDNGIPYDPTAAEDPDITLDAEERGIGGLGIFMVKKLMDRLEYKYESNENVVGFSLHFE